MTNEILKNNNLKEEGFFDNEKVCNSCENIEGIYGNIEKNNVDDFEENKDDETLNNLEKSFEDLTKINGIDSKENEINSKLTPKEKEVYAEENEALIHYVLKTMHFSSYEELYNVGLLGFAKALDTYKKDKNTKFATYAIKCIRNEVLFFLRREEKHTKNTVSFNTILSSDKDGHILQLEDTIAAEDIDDKKSLESTILDKENKKIIDQAMKHLKEEERFIIINRFGLNNGEKMTQKEIAKAINMSQANVSKIEKNSLNKLKLYIRKEVFFD